MLMMLLSAHPEVWMKAMERAGNPARLHATQSARPELETLIEQFYAALDPRVRHALATRLEPTELRGGARGEGLGSPVMPALMAVGGSLPVHWMRAAMEGRMAQVMQPWLNPATYLEWVRLPAEPLRGNQAAKPVYRY